MLLAHLAYLCDRLTLALREDRLYAHVIEVKARYADFKTEIKRRLVLSPLQEMGKIYKIAEELFLELVAGSRLALRLVGVKASDLVRVRPLVALRALLGAAGEAGPGPRPGPRQVRLRLRARRPGRRCSMPSTPSTRGGATSSRRRP